MEIGCIAPGIIRTFRYFQGSEMIVTKKGHVVVARPRFGGICFFFEINHKKGTVLFSSSITLDDELYCKQKGRELCVQRAHNDAAKTYELPYTDGVGLLDQVFTMLDQAHKTGELGDKPYLRTLLNKMRLYDQQNAETANMYQDMIDSGVISIPA